MAPMRRLILLRHAKSDWPDGVPDHERPLAKRGRRTAPLMGTYLVKQGLLPDLALISTARRAIETWELASAACGRTIAWKEEPRLYDAAATTLLDIVREAPRRIGTLLIVGHNPGLEEFAGILIGKGPEPALSALHQKFPTAGLAVIDFAVQDWTEIADGLGELELFQTPKSIGGDTES